MLKLKIMKFFKILPIIVFIFTEMNAQKITYYTNNNEEFADKDAIIVTGTVIDESIGNELIVTVIATGLGNVSSSNSRSLNSSPPTRLGSPSSQSPSERAPLPLSDAARNLIDNPPSIEKAIEKKKVKEQVAEGKAKDEEYLDIPSFVRTQLD